MKIRHLFQRGLVTIVCIVATACSVKADFLVNDDVTGGAPQDGVDAAIAEDGSFVVVWRDGRNNESDIYAQRYDADGKMLGVNFRVNPEGESAYAAPAIAMKPNGEFYVTWPIATPSKAVRYRRYDASGNATGAAKTVSELSAAFENDRRPVDIAISEGGAFCIAWNTTSELLCQRFSYLGEKVGDVLVVAEGSRIKSAAIGKGGTKFCVVWEDYADYNIHGRLFAGSAFQTPFTVCNAEGYQGLPDIGMNEDNSFIVAWRDARNEPLNPSTVAFRYFNGDGTPNGEERMVSGPLSTGPAISSNGVVAWAYMGNILMERFGNAGSALADMDTVNVNSYGNAFALTSVAANASGDFVVAWNSNATGDGNPAVQMYNATGTKKGDNLVASDDAGSSDQTSAAVAVAPDGRRVVVWEDYRNSQYYSSIYLQLYSASGEPVGENQLVSPADADNSASEPKAAFAQDGAVWVVWAQVRFGSDKEIYARRFGDDGSALGERFQVNDDNGSMSQSSPFVQAAGEDDIWIVWSDRRNKTGGGSVDFYGRIYASDGSEKGSDFIISENESGTTAPCIDANAQGKVCVTWIQVESSSSWVVKAKCFNGAQDAGKILEFGSGSGVISSNAKCAILPNGSVCAGWLSGKNEVYSITMQIIDDTGIKMLSADEQPVAASSNLGALSAPCLTAYPNSNLFAFSWLDYSETKPRLVFKIFNSEGESDDAVQTVDDAESSVSWIHDADASDQGLMFAWTDDRRITKGHDIYAEYIPWNITDTDGAHNAASKTLLQEGLRVRWSGSKVIFDFMVSEPGMGTIYAFDVTGRRIATMYKGKLVAGHAQLSCIAPTGLANGVFLYHLAIGHKQWSVRAQEHGKQ